MSDREGSGSRSISRSRSAASLKRSASESQSRSSSSHRHSKSRSRERRRSRSRSGSCRHSSHRSRSRSRSYDRRRSSHYFWRRVCSSRDRDYDRHYDDRRYDDRRYDDRRYDDRYYDDRRRDNRGYGRSRSRSPMSQRRRHLGDRENPQTSRCLGVFGLSLHTQERELRDVFERYGPIDDLQIVYDHQTGKSRGFAFLYFKNVDDAVEAKENAAGQELDGRKIRVDYSITKRAHTPTPGVYLGHPTSESHYSGGHERRSRSPHKARGPYSRSYSRSYSPARRF